MSPSVRWLPAPPAPTTALYLALSMSFAILWGRSYHVCESWDLDQPGQKISLASDHGRLCLERLATAGPRASRLAFSRGRGYHADPAADRPAAPSVLPKWQLGGFSFTNGHIESIAIQDLTVPYWFLVSATACAAIASAERASRQPPPGHCEACGYNLTANVSGTCPECGTLLSSV